MTLQATTETYDIAVIGAGPGGSAAAIDAARSGLKVAVIEREEFPRFHIGESLTGEAGKVLRDWGLQDKIGQIGHVEKRGTHVHGASENSFYIPIVGVDDDGVTRSPSLAWQVDRAGFDKLLLDCAIESGAELLRGTATAPLTDDDGAVTGVRVATSDGDVDVRARCTIDASGQGRFMAKQKLAGEIERGKYSRQVAFYTHLAGVDRSSPDGNDDTRIFFASVNHWAWLIPVTPEITSIGIVGPSQTFRDRGETVEEFVAREMIELHPELGRRCADATMTRPVESAHNFSYQIRDFSGPGWLAVGDAHRFVDPIFSLGVCCALLEGRRAAELCGVAIEQDLSPTQAHQQLFQPFEKWADDGIDVVQDLIDAFWGNPTGFGYLVHYKHHDDLVDVFAGRFYGMEAPSKGREALGQLASRFAVA